MGHAGTAVVVLLTALGLAPQRGIDLSREPWRTVMAALQRDGEGAAQRALERAAGGGGGLAGWERAHALRWAGQIALRGGRLADARRDLLAARAADPAGFEGAMSAVHLGEVAIREGRWRAAERVLAEVEHDRDVVVRTYARDRLRAVRERTRRLALRHGALACVALGLAALATRVYRRRRDARVGPAFGRALLVGEAAALLGAIAVPRTTDALAAPGWMAFALPGAVVAALFVATRAPQAAAWQRALGAAAVACVLAAGLYLALDYTWWSVARPVP